MQDKVTFSGGHGLLADEEALAIRGLSSGMKHDVCELMQKGVKHQQPSDADAIVQ